MFRNAHRLDASVENVIYGDRSADNNRKVDTTLTGAGDIISGGHAINCAKKTVVG